MIQDIIDQQRARGFPAFAGTMIRGRLPLKETLLNEVLREALTKRGGAAVREASLQVLADNRMVVRLTAMIGPFAKNVAITLDIESLIDLTVAPRLVLRIVRTEGFFGLSLETLVGFFRPLPGIVTVSGSTIAVDLRAAVAPTPFADILPLVHQDRLRFDAGRAFRRFSYPGGPNPMNQELIARLLQNDLADLEGLQISGSVPVKQELINAVLAELLQGDSGAPPAAGAGDDAVGADVSAPPRHASPDRKALQNLLRRMVKRAEITAENGAIVFHFDIQR